MCSSSQDIVVSNRCFSCLMWKCQVMWKMKHWCEAELVEIWVQALFGHSSLQTIWSFEQQSIEILIDSGSTHNFIDPTTAKQIGCLMHARECLNIMVAIGSKFPCHGKCPNMWLTIQGYQLHTNIYALLLGACDIMFGSQWLLTLCPILWDFNEWKMQFSCYGKGFTLKERRMEQNRLWMLINMQRLIPKRTPCAIA